MFTSNQHVYTVEQLKHQMAEAMKQRKTIPTEKEKKKRRWAEEHEEEKKQRGMHTMELIEAHMKKAANQEEVQQLKAQKFTKFREYHALKELQKSLKIVEKLEA